MTDSNGSETTIVGKTERKEGGKGMGGWRKQEEEEREREARGSDERLKIGLSG